MCTVQTVWLLSWYLVTHNASYAGLHLSKPVDFNGHRRVFLWWRWYCQSHIIYLHCTLNASTPLSLHSQNASLLIRTSLVRNQVGCLLCMEISHLICQVLRVWSNFHLSQGGQKKLNWNERRLSCSKAWWIVNLDWGPLTCSMLVSGVLGQIGAVNKCDSIYHQYLFSGERQTLLGLQDLTVCISPIDSCAFLKYCCCSF